MSSSRAEILCNVELEFFVVYFVLPLNMKHSLCRKPIASMVYGSNAVVVKPALSLAPMVVAGILNKYGYDAVKDGTATAAQTLILKNTIFNFSCFAPVIIGVIQIIVWRKYKLRGGSNPPSTTTDL